MKRFLFILTILLLIISYSNQKINAQTEPIDQLIKIEVVPTAPKQNESVNINIESYSYDLSHAKISWYLNGALRDSGIGKKFFSFTAGDVGAVSNIMFQIRTAEGVLFTRTVSISPGSVTLLWESTGYTPPFYKGKSLFSYEGQLRFIAVPNLLNSNGVKYKANELVYTWKRGMGTDEVASGYGRNIFLWNGGIISSPQKIEVIVSNIENTAKAVASVVINPQQAEIIAYENDPSLGILWNKAITNTFNIVGVEASFVASPFYFNNPDAEGIYSWFVNGTKSGETTKYITFRNTTGSEGYSKISFDLSSQKRILQSAGSGFNISFGGKAPDSSLNIFKGFFGQ